MGMALEHFPGILYSALLGFIYFASSLGARVPGCHSKVQSGRGRPLQMGLARPLPVRWWEDWAGVLGTLSQGLLRAFRFVPQTTSVRSYAPMPPLTLAVFRMFWVTDLGRTIGSPELCLLGAALSVCPGWWGEGAVALVPVSSGGSSL